jgi:hypothetical protein
MPLKFCDPVPKWSARSAFGPASGSCSSVHCNVHASVEFWLDRGGLPADRIATAIASTLPSADRLTRRDSFATPHAR